MKTPFVFAGLLLLATAFAQQHEELRTKGVIYGIVIGQDGQPSKGIGLTARPLGVELSGGLPRVKTNDAGEYRFENLSSWGKYTVYVEDEDAGYSSFSTGTAFDSHPSEVEVTPEHPEAGFDVYVPPKAGFLRIRLTNRRTAVRIREMRVEVMPMEKPELPLFTMSGSSSRVLLVPPDRNLLLHVTSDGFREWDESVGGGKALHLPSGTRLALAVQLEPLD